MTLAGRVAVVTGGGRGIGRALVQALAQDGTRVAAVARTLEQVEETARLVEKEGGEALAVRADVTDPASLAAMVRDVIAAFGRLDVLVNNAGVLHAGLVEHMPAEAFARTLHVNVVGTFLATQAVVPTMRARGGGKIINVASAFGVTPVVGHAAYCASKAAIMQLTRVVALELAAAGIQVNAIAPGYVATEMSAEALADPEVAERIVRRIPAGRVAQPEELGPLVAFLASSAADYLTGAVITVDGGFHLR